MRKLCAHEGCTNVIKKGGACVRHGANKERKLCSYEGCIKYSKKVGVCVRHGADDVRKLCIRSIRPGQWSKLVDPLF